MAAALRPDFSPSRMREPTAASGQAATTTTKQHAAAENHRPGLRQLCVGFAAWKLLLLAVAGASPGPGYDTSTRILLDAAPTPPDRPAQVQLAVEHLVTRLTRWDAIYFASASARGHIHEQEWAFSPYFATVTSTIARVFSGNAHASPILSHALVGVLVAHLSHFVAVIALYFLTFSIIPASEEKKREISIVSACLHIISPAGLFLSASYGESFFALNNFIGMVCYIQSSLIRHRSNRSIVSWSAAGYMVLSGVCFAQATLTRSNGLLNGIIFAWDAVEYLPRLLHLVGRKAWGELLHLISVLISGILLAVAYATPQLLAYLEYCIQGRSRPWCTHVPPSIYAWVQHHYWNVGLFRYWTLSNLPLFALAAPMLVMLGLTSWIAINKSHIHQAAATLNQREQPTPGFPPTGGIDAEFFAHVIARLALPQLVLAVMAATSFHVQIINRISSGYPVWYILLAIELQASQQPGPTSMSTTILRTSSRWSARAMAMYAIIQGGLYASFLPPA